jgi:hypothetical protein
MMALRSWSEFEALQTARSQFDRRHTFVLRRSRFISNALEYDQHGMFLRQSLGRGSGIARNCTAVAGRFCVVAALPLLTLTSQHLTFYDAHERGSAVHFIDLRPGQRCSPSSGMLCDQIRMFLSR